MTASTLDKQELREIIADTIDVEIAEVTDTAVFVEDLDVDSLMALEVMVVLERRYAVKIDEEQFRKITCLADAYDMLNDKLQVS